MAKKPITTEADEKEPGTEVSSIKEALGAVAETSGLALTPEDLAAAAKQSSVLTKWYLHRREQYVAPGGRVVYNLVFEVVQPKRDPATQRMLDVENAEVFEGQDKYVGTMTLAYVKPEKAERFQVGKEYTFEFTE